MEKVIIITTREDAHSLRVEVLGHPEVGLQRGKKASIALGKLVEHNPHLFNIHKDGERDTGLKIRKEQIGKNFYAIVQDRPLIKFERADSFEEALGQLIQHNHKEFNVEEIKHIGK